MIRVFGFLFFMQQLYLLAWLITNELLQSLGIAPQWLHWALTWMISGLISFGLFVWIYEKVQRMQD